jgi:hypothetical protein
MFFKRKPTLATHIKLFPTDPEIATTTKFV